MNIETIEIAKLELERGDILVVRVSPDIDMDNASKAVKAAMEGAGAVGVPLLIGPPGVDFSVIRAPAKEESKP